MKLRAGFVSNSSSSSFVIDKKHLTKVQIVLIHGHLEVGRRLGQRFAGEGNQWHIHEGDDKIEGWTSMDNFDMQKFLRDIEVDDDHIKWDRGCW